MKNLISSLIEKLSFKALLTFAILLGILFYGIAVYWSFEPKPIDLKSQVAIDAKAEHHQIVTGYTSVSALIYISETLLDKPGGFLSNDVLPPSIFMDNMPSWELGALQMIRDHSLALRDGFSRSQSQSVDSPALNSAHSLFSIEHTNWMVPSAENSYRNAINELKSYRNAIANTGKQNDQFYARADNLNEWLGLIEKKLGNYSQRLSASIGKRQLNLSLVGDSAAKQSTQVADSNDIQTNWFLIDDEFYEARGAAWALLHLLRAAEIDFKKVLDKKNASVSLKQIIRELEGTQTTLWSPMVLNGSGFGILANHSLVMASYISRANAALINLRTLLNNG